MPARIRSLLNGITPIDEASRDDLSLADLVSFVSLDTEGSYKWDIAFRPEGSAAAFSGDDTEADPGHFIADCVGPFLISLTVNEGLITEDRQYVRVRVPTSILGLLFTAAGERRDSTGTIPIDVSPTGWTNDLNRTLLRLESATRSVNVRVVTSNDSVRDSDYLLYVNDPGEDLIEIQLPRASDFPGRKLELNQRNLAPGSLVVFEGDDIDGENSVQTYVKYESLTLTSDGVTSWSKS